MTPAARVVDAVARHHFVLQALPKVLEPILHVVALELVHVFYSHVVIGANLDLEAWYSVQHFLVIPNFVLIRVQQIVNFLIVQLDVLASYRNFIHVSANFPTLLNSSEQFTNASRDEAIRLVRDVRRVFWHLWHYQMGLIRVRDVLVAFHGVGLA